MPVVNKYLAPDSVFIFPCTTRHIFCNISRVSLNGRNICIGSMPAIVICSQLILLCTLCYHRLRKSRYVIIKNLRNGYLFISA